MDTKTDIGMEKSTKPWRWEEDGYTVTRGAAWSGPGCHDGCGVLLYTNKDGKLVKVEGDPDNPFNQGRLCVRCLALPEVTNHEDRLKYPLKRVGKRGENKWERISWDEAYDTIESEFNKVKNEYGPESVIFAQGTGRDIAAVIAPLAYAFGSPNWAYLLSGSACYVPRMAGSMALMGTFCTADCSQYFADRYENKEWKVPECIVIWANNPLVANADGFFGHWVVDCMKRGSKLIVVDPRLTWLASRADIWLQLRPGTDTALALAMINIIIQEGLYDKEFVDNWTYGFEKLAKRAAEYPVEKVAEITWIPKEKIIAAARLYAKSKPAATQWGLGIDMTKEAIPATQALSAMWCITGNMDVPGGMLNCFQPFDATLWLPPDPTDFMSQEMADKRLGLEKYPLFRYGFALTSTESTIGAMLTGKPYPVKAAWLQTTNPIACTSMEPETSTFKALRGLDFVVDVDLFMTPTAVAFADIVLPAATYPERDGLRGLWYYLQTINKVTQVGEAKSDVQICFDLAKRFNPEKFPWETSKEWLSSRIVTSGMTFDELRERGPAYPPFEYKKYEKGLARQDGQPGFNKGTGRIELYSTFFEANGLDPLPYYEEPTTSPYSTPELYEKYPLVLTTGARPWAFFHSEQRQVKRLRKIKPDPQIEIHPQTAENLGIKNGDWVWIENDFGKCKQRAKITPIVDPRVVAADHGWWFPEKEAAEPSLYGVFESNINKLMPWLCGRSGFGSNCKSLLCKIYKVKEEEI